MKKKRIGNDIRVVWTLLVKDTQEPFIIQAADIALYLKSRYGKERIEGYSVLGNVLTWTFLGKDQKTTGEYSLVLVLNEDALGMLTHDACNFVQLVSCSCQEGGEDECGVSTETIEIESLVDVASSGGTITIVIDGELSTTSTNPVENRVITSALESKADVSALDGKADASALEGKADKSELDAYQPKGDYLTEIPSDVLESIDNKVDKIEGKGLSSNDYTDTDKSKLSGLENYDDSALRTLVSGKVDKVSGKGLSSNDFTDAYKDALDGLDEALSDKQDVITDLDSIRSKANSALQEVPEGYVKEEDVATINGQSILNGGNIEIEGGGESYDDTELRGLIAEKQDELVSGTNIKTINGNSILGSGNIEIQGGDGSISAEIVDTEARAAQLKDNGEVIYPITKPECVIDENGKTIQQMMAKWGVVSQTQTWTEASDGGYDYVMSDLVRGWIPQANIDLFVSAGAVFNEESGYFELNGLTDISYEEMQKIYYQSHPFIRRIYLDDAFAGTKIRTNLPIWSNMSSTSFGSIAHSQINLSGVCAYNPMEVFSWVDDATVLSSNVKNHIPITNILLGFRNYSYGSRLRSILGVINSSNLTSLYEAFVNCVNLEDVLLTKLKAKVEFAQSPRLSTDSILYMINNEAATSVITITLHATALARAMADTRITSALETHTNITLAEA